jgi:hypothetical protein
MGFFIDGMWVSDEDENYQPHLGPSPSPFSYVLLIVVMIAVILYSWYC